MVDRADIVSGVADGLEVLDILVWDIHVEALLGCDDDLDHRESVNIEVFGEGLVKLDVLVRDTGDLVEDLGENFEDFFLRSCYGPDLVLRPYIRQFGMKQNVDDSRSAERSFRLARRGTYDRAS